MRIENLGSLVYRPERNRVYYIKPGELRAFEKYGKGAIRRALEMIVSELIPILPREADIHLEGCIATSNVLRKYSEDRIEVLNVLIYPKSGRIRYKLKRTGKFATTLHQQRSPIIITGLDGLYLKNNGKRHIWIPGNPDFFNEINGALLFNENPFDFPPRYFQEVIDYDPLNEDK
jgi:hypothetical protein